SQGEQDHADRYRSDADPLHVTEPLAEDQPRAERGDRGELGGERGRDRDAFSSAPCHGEEAADLAGTGDDDEWQRRAPDPEAAADGQWDRDQRDAHDARRQDGPTDRKVRTDASRGIQARAEREAGQPAERDRADRPASIDGIGVRAERREDDAQPDDGDADRLDGREALSGEDGQDRGDRTFGRCQRTDDADLAGADRDVLRAETDDVAQARYQQEG